MTRRSQSFEHALALKPDYGEAHNNRGNALLDLNRPAEALTDYDAAIARKPFAFALVNRGSALRYLGRTEEAIDSFDRAIALEPDMPEAHWNKALLQLALGDFAQGWRRLRMALARRHRTDAARLRPAAMARRGD